MGADHCCGAQALGAGVSVVVAHWLQTTGSVGVVPGLSCFKGVWNPPRPGIAPVSPALTGGFLTTGPTGKSQILVDYNTMDPTFLVQPMACLRLSSYSQVQAKEAAPI